jgi:hypothetical protein
MLQKTFQVLLVTFVVIFTSAGLVLLFSAIASLLRPAQTGGISAVTGGASFHFINLTAAIVLLLIIAAVYLLTRRNKLR